MTQMSRRAFAAFSLAAAFAACGRRETARISGSGPTPASLRVVPPQFDDVKPVSWPGRAPRTYPVHGIDVSRWQGQIDWASAREGGVNFAFIKATEGGDLVDPLFRSNWDGARAAGVPAGAYHFWYHCRGGAEQARWFIRHVPREAGALPPVLDIEWTPFSPTCAARPDPAVVRAEAEAFLRIVEPHYGQRAILYSTSDFWTGNEMWHLPGGHEYWLRSVTEHPSDAYGGQRWTFWQYTGSGVVRGIAGRTDINVFAGSEDAWQSWLTARTA
jgi:lysozyme